MSLDQLLTFFLFLIFLVRRFKIIIVGIILILKLGGLSIDDSNLVTISPLNFLSMIINCIYLVTIFQRIDDGRRLYAGLVNYGDNLFQFLLENVVFIVAFYHMGEVGNGRLDVR